MTARCAEIIVNSSANMAVKTEKDLSETQRSHWLKAVTAIELRTFLEENARDVKVLHELGRLYHDMGQSEQEVEIYNRITEIDPLDAQALRLGKDASAHASMKTGGWTQAESYRDLIKDKEAP